MSLVTCIGTLAIVLGKFYLGPPTDRIGGFKSLKLSLVFMSILLLGSSFCTNIQSFGLIWTMLSFVYGAGWGAVGSAIRAAFPESDWASKIGIVAACSRLGSMSSSISVGYLLLRCNNNWRVIFQAAALFQVISLAICMILYDDKTENHQSPFVLSNQQTLSMPKAAPTEESIPDVPKRVSRLGKFWFMLSGKVSLMVVGQFISFMAMYLNTGN